MPAPPFPFQLEDIRPSGQPSTPEPTANGSGYGYGAAQVQNPYASAYGAPANTQQYGGYGATAAPAASTGYGTAGTAASRAYTSPSPSAGYSAAPSYGSSAATGGYGQPAQQQPQQPSFVPATSAVPAPAAGGYGAPTSYSTSQAAAGYGQQSYGSYGQQAQPTQQVYQPHKTRPVSSTQVGLYNRVVVLPFASLLLDHLVFVLSCCQGSFGAGAGVTRGGVLSLRAAGAAAQQVYQPHKQPVSSTQVGLR